MNALMNSGSITPPVSAVQANALREAQAPSAASALAGVAQQGDTLRDQIAGLSPAQKAFAARHAEILGAMGQGLAGLEPSQRRAALDHIAPALIATGVPAAAIAAFEPTDENLAGVIGEAQSLKAMLSST